METISSFIVPQLMDSAVFKTALDKLKIESFFNFKTMLDGRSRDQPNFPSLGILGILNGTSHPMTSASSPFISLASILDLMIAFKKSHSSIDLAKFKQNFLQSEGLKQYLSLVTLNSAGNFRGSRSNWFCRPEVNFLHQTIMSIILFKPNELENDLIVRSAMTLMTHYQLSDAIRAKLLMDQVIFSDDYLGDSLVASILDKTHITRDAKTSPIMSNQVNLSNLKDIYLKNIFKDMTDVQQTKILWIEKCPFSLPSLVLNNHGETLLPGDWQYLPLLSILSNQKQDLASEMDIFTVKSCLLWVRIMNFCVGIKSAVFCYSRLATVFLAASDLFLNSEVKSLIFQCLSDILKSGKSLVFKNSRLPGIESFEEFFKELVSQFLAVSYGDSLFAMLLLIPLTKGNTLKLTSILWIDYAECLRSITLKKEDLIEPLKLSDFIDHVDDKDIVLAMVKALVNKSVIKKRNSLLFEIAVGVIKKSFEKDEKLKDEITKQLKSVDIKL